MKLSPRFAKPSPSLRLSSPPRTPRATLRAFTLAEALAALAFMALVIPVAVEGLRIANLAGQVAVRKEAAARVADRILNELIVTRQWQQTSSGAVEEGPLNFRWQLQNQTWEKDTLRLLSIQVTFNTQAHDYHVVLSTVVDTASQ